MNSHKRRSGYDALVQALQGESPGVPYDEVDWTTLHTRIMERAEIWFEVSATHIDDVARTPAKAATLTAARR
jgi:hypothetical protein